jgi:LysW-gamma-L-lysine carboxypeptidase
VDHAARVDLLRSMVDIPSVSGAETELAAWLVERMTKLGLDAYRDEVGNVIGGCGAATGPELMLLGHIDTVPGTPPVRLAGDVLHGRGTVDAKGPFATMICAAVAAAEAAVPARIVVVGAVDEERTSIGARHLARRPAPDAVVIGEPSGAGCVGIGYKGVFRFRMSATQPAAHTSSLEPSAAELVAEFWPAVRDWLVRGDCAPAATAEPALFERALPTVIGIGGGLEEAYIDVSCRVPMGFDTAEFGVVLSRLAEGHQVTVIEDVPAVRARPDDHVVRAISGAIRATGVRPVHKLKLGTADWNVVAPRWGVPTAAYGPGDSRLCHTDEERLPIGEYLTAVDILTDALGRLARAVPSAHQPATPLSGSGGSNT